MRRTPHNPLLDHTIKDGPLVGPSGRFGRFFFSFQAGFFQKFLPFFAPLILALDAAVSPLMFFASPSKLPRTPVFFSMNYL